MAKKIQGALTVVTLIGQKGASALVEFLDANGVLCRKYVPLAKIENSMVADETLAAGIPYGIAWNEISLEFDAEKFAVEMHNADLWTANDVLRNPKKVSAVLRKILESGLKELLEMSRQEEKRS